MSWWEQDQVIQAGKGADNVNVSEGRRGLGSAEAKTAEQDIQQALQARSVLGNFAHMQALNAMLPATGRFEAAVAEAEGRLPSGWQREQLPLYQTYRALATQAIQPTAELVSGKPLGASQMNTPAEFEIWKSAGMSPTLQPEAARAVGDQLAAKATERIARSTFNQRWRAAFGSTGALDRRGRTIEQAWADFVASPDFEQKVRYPISRRVEQAIAKRQGQQSRGFKIERID